MNESSSTPSRARRLASALRQREVRRETAKMLRGVAWLKRLVAILFLLLTASLILGCESLTASSKERTPPPSAAMEQCDPATPLAGKKGLDLSEKLIEVGGKLNDCKAKHSALIEWVENGN